MSRYSVYTGAYLGGAEAQSLIGKWHEIVGAGPQYDITGADVSYRPYANYGRPSPFAPQPQPQYQPWRPHHHRRGQPRYPWLARPRFDQWGRPQPAAPAPYAAPYVAPAYPAATVRDHRRAALARQYRVSGDPIALVGISLMGAEDAAAAAQGTVPPDATQPAPPLAPAQVAETAAVEAQAATLPPPPPEVVQAQAAQTAQQSGTPDDGGGYGGYDGGYRRGGAGCIPPRNWLMDRPSAHRADRIILPMSSGVNILPNTSAQITSRPQNVAFRPERLIIGGTPANWIVNDVKVGNRSQFSQSGDIPGELFSSTAVDVFVSMETVQTAMDFVMLVTFVGASESGEPFVCGVLGTAAV